MTKKCYYLENSAEAALAVNSIESNFPCFTTIDILDDGYIEFTISCRNEDVAIIERILANFV
jgi:hypothetical protein